MSEKCCFSGGGLPIGSILLIEEDKIGRYAKCLSKLFLAEGIVHKHALFVANLDQNPQDMVRLLHSTEILFYSCHSKQFLFAYFFNFKNKNRYS